MTDDLTYVRNMLKMCNIREVSKQTGMPYMTVYKIGNGKTKNPTYETVKVLSEFFRGIK